MRDRADVALYSAVDERLTQQGHIARDAKELQLAAEDLHEGGFAAAVGTDQAVAVAVAEFDGHVFEQRLGAKLHGDVGGGDHGQSWY